MNKKIFLRIGSVIVIIVMGLIGMSLLGSNEKQSNKRELDPEIRTVEIQTINFGDLTLEVKGNGVIESKKVLKIVSEVNGQIVFAKNNLKNGTYVTNGERIVKIDDIEVSNNLYSLRSELINTIASVLPDLKIENQSIYDKWYKYFLSIDINKNVPDLPEIKNSQEKIKISVRNIFSKYYAVKNSEILLSKYTITAQFDGYIQSRGIIKNSYVSRGQELLTLTDAKNLEIAVPLLVDEVNMINFNTSPLVNIYPENNGHLKRGKIVRKETILNRNSQSLNVYVSLQNNDLNPYFLPGNYVNVDIKGKILKNVASIPRHIVDNQNYVYIMKDGLLDKIKVKIEAFQNNDVIITNTIPQNSKVVTTILQKPLIGMKIQSKKDDNPEIINTTKDTDTVSSIY